MYRNNKGFPISDLDGNAEEVEYDMAEQEIGELEPQPKRTRGPDKKPRKRRETKAFPMNNEPDVEYHMTEQEAGELIPEPKRDGTGGGQGRGQGQMKKDGTGKGNGRGKADLAANLKKSGLASAMKPDGTKGKSFMDRLKALGYTK